MFFPVTTIMNFFSMSRFKNVSNSSQQHAQIEKDGVSYHKKAFYPFCDKKPYNHFFPISKKEKKGKNRVGWVGQAITKK